MNIVINDKVVEIKPMDRLNAIGKTFEVASILEDKIVLRDSQTKVAVCSVDINEFEKYFVKEKEYSGWTDWSVLADHRGNVIGYYKTNMRKVMVKMTNGVKAMATCNCKHGDEFNLATGIQIALMRCINKSLNKAIEEYNYIIDELKNEFVDNNDRLDKLIGSMIIR